MLLITVNLEKKNKNLNRRVPISPVISDTRFSGADRGVPRKLSGLPLITESSRGSPRTPTGRGGALFNHAFRVPLAAGPLPLLKEPASPTESFNVRMKSEPEHGGVGWIMLSSPANTVVRRRRRRRQRTSATGRGHRRASIRPDVEISLLR